SRAPSAALRAPRSHASAAAGRPRGLRAPSAPAERGRRRAPRRAAAPPPRSGRRAVRADPVSGQPLLLLGDSVPTIASPGLSSGPGSLATLMRQRRKRSLVGKRAGEEQ